MDSPIEYHAMPGGRRIAFRFSEGRGPLLVFLPGYMSDMGGSKACALLAWAEQTGRACLLLDYSGCGFSAGDFADGTLSGWRDEVLSLIAARGHQRVVLVGSSMGGWLMLLVAEALGSRVAGLVGVAAAPDFTDWGRSSEEAALLEAGETVFDPNPYGPEPTPMHARFFADAQKVLRLDRTIPIDCAVRLIHGQRDDDVPFEISLRLAAKLRSDDIQVTLIKDGDHRLSRPQDITLLLRAIAEVAGE